MNSHKVDFEAMLLARRLHKDQKRKYTGNPYFEHLAEVVGIVSSVAEREDVVSPEIMRAVAWLHDAIEDQNLDFSYLLELYGTNISYGVAMLSDLEKGNRAERKALSCKRLATAPRWVQTIKCADLISNTASIRLHDPGFAVLYLKEKRALLDAMEHADPLLRDLAYSQVE